MLTGRFRRELHPGLRNCSDSARCLCHQPPIEEDGTGESEPQPGSAAVLLSEPGDPLWWMGSVAAVASNEGLHT